MLFLGFGSLKSDLNHLHLIFTTDNKDNSYLLVVSIKTMRLRKIKWFVLRCKIVTDRKVYICCTINFTLFTTLVPRWFTGKESACQAGNSGLILGSGRSPGGGNGNPLQYCCLGNPITEESSGLQAVGSQKCQTQLSN